MSKANTIKYKYIYDVLQGINPIDEEHGILTIEDIRDKYEKIFNDYIDVNKITMIIFCQSRLTVFRVQFICMLRTCGLVLLPRGWEEGRRGMPTAIIVLFIGVAVLLIATVVSRGRRKDEEQQKEQEQKDE